MKCPLLTIASVWASPEQTIKALDCLKEECAWWSKENGVCAVLTLAQGSVYAHKALLNIANELARIRQLGK